MPTHTAHPMGFWGWTVPKYRIAGSGRNGVARSMAVDYARTGGSHGPDLGRPGVRHAHALSRPSSGRTMPLPMAARRSGPGERHVPVTPKATRAARKPRRRAKRRASTPPTIVDPGTPGRGSPNASPPKLVGLKPVRSRNALIHDLIALPAISMPER